jgi:hypothetical protein
MSDEPSAGAVEAATFWCTTGEEQNVPDSRGDIGHLAEIIDRLAVQPALAAERAKVGTLREAGQGVIEHTPCSDTDCCKTAMQNEAAREQLRAALAETDD